MRGGQAHEQKRAALREHLLAERLMAVKIVAQHGGAPRRDMRAPSVQPTRGGIEFAVLFCLPVLRANEFRRQREHRCLSRCEDHRCHGDMGVLDFAVTRRARRALRTMDRFRAVVFGAVECDQYPSIGAAVLLQCAVPVQCVDEVDEYRCQMIRRDRIEQVADLLGARDLMDPEQRAGVVAALFLPHPSLIVQKRWTLHEERRESAQPGVADHVRSGCCHPCGDPAGRTTLHVYAKPHQRLKRGLEQERQWA